MDGDPELTLLNAEKVDRIILSDPLRSFQLIEPSLNALKHKGIMVIKCQDIVHNHKLFCTHAHILNWSSEFFRLKDLFVQAATHRMPAPNRRGTQKHARIFHSYWIVLQRWAR